jgi:integration host factor subunit beta
LTKITKAEIVDAIYEKISVDRKAIREIVDLFIEEAKSALGSRKAIELRGFGTFEIKIRKGREKEKKQKTGEILSVGSHGIVSFRAGKELRQEVWSLKQEELGSIQNGKPTENGEGA